MFSKDNEWDDDAWDDDHESPETLAQRNEEVKRRRERQLAQLVSDEIHHPKVFVRRIGVDARTGEPYPVTATVLVEGGIEYFNEHDVNHPDTFQQGPINPSPRVRNDIPIPLDAVTNGDVEIGQYMEQGGSSSPPVPSPSAITAMTPAPENTRDKADFLTELGLGFLRETPAVPTRHVRIVWSGQTRCQLPFPCHHIVTTDKLVVLVTDIRSTPDYQDYEFDLDKGKTAVHLLLPDGSEIPVLPPVPKTLSFEVGTLRCTLFAKQGTGSRGQGTGCRK